MEILLIIMFAPLALMLGCGLLCVLLDPRFWLWAIILGTLFFVGMSLKAGASVVEHKATVALPELSGESSGPRCVS